MSEVVPVRDNKSRTVPARDNQNSPGAGKAIFKAVVHQTKAAMDHKALNATQLNKESKNHKYTIGDQVKKSFRRKIDRGKL